MSENENMKRPKLKTLEALEDLNNQINALYEKKREVVTKIVEAYGATEFLYELEEPTADGDKFVRYKFKDNLEEFASGKPMYKACSFERYGFECKYLKKEPK